MDAQPDIKVLDKKVVIQAADNVSDMMNSSKHSMLKGRFLMGDDRLAPPALVAMPCTAVDACLAPATIGSTRAWHPH